MKYDFETMVQRGSSNLKDCFTDPAVREAGNISFDGAEPDFKTAPVIEEAVIRLAKNGLYGFTLPDARYLDSLVWWMEHSRKTRVKPEWVVTTLGTIHSVAETIRLCTKEGESILITSPIYNRYEQAAVRLYRKALDCPMKLEPGNGQERAGQFRYVPDFEAIEEGMKRPDVHLLVLCNPQNPIGQIWSVEELTRISELANRYGVTVFSDEIFADNCYEGRQCPCYLDIPGAKQHAIVSVSLGKAFHFTGVNHANVLIANPRLREAFADRRTRDHYGSLDPLAYEAQIAAYTPEGLDWLREANRYVEENIRRIRSWFAAELPQTAVYGGEGGYVLWMDWRELFASEEELIDFLYHKAFFHVDAGSSYGAARFTRMCVASPWYAIERALGTLKQAWQEKNGAGSVPGRQ